MMKTCLALVLVLVAVASANYANYNANSLLNLVSLSANPVSGLAVVIPAGQNGRPQVIMPGTNVAIDVYWGFNPPIRVPGEQVATVSDKVAIGADNQGNRYVIASKVALEPNGNVASLGLALFRKVNLQGSTGYGSTGHSSSGYAAGGAAAAGAK